MIFQAQQMTAALALLWPLLVLADDVVSVETIKSEDDVLYVTPDHRPDVYFSEHFDHPEEFEKRWILSQAKKEGVDEHVAKYDGEWKLESASKNPLSGDLGLVMKSKAKHAAIAAQLKKPFLFQDQEFVVQYELNFQKGQNCGGGYIKLLSHKPDMDLKSFHDKTPYTIMFGPDRCGFEGVLHFIFRHVNPKNQTVTEKHCKKLDMKNRAILEEAIKDERPHLYRLVIRPDNTFEMSIDYKIVNHGSLFDDFEPPVNPPQEIDDPNDFKPEDWDEREKIPDPDARKPDDWDESQPMKIMDESATMPDGWLEDELEEVPDPEAQKPDDWDDEMDGEWEAPLVPNPACKEAVGCGKWRKPMIDNPLYKGKWQAPMINNPNYKGKWKPRKIANPDYFFDPHPFKMTSIGGVGIELWSMSEDIYFDNILIADSVAAGDSWAKDTYDLKVQKLDVNDAGLLKRIILYSNRNPWLYAVYLVVVGLPLVLIITFSYSGSGSSSATDDSAKAAAGKAAGSKDPKKTDAIQEDDAEKIDEEGDGDKGADVEDEDGEQPEGSKQPTRRRKARKE